MSHLLRGLAARHIPRQSRAFSGTPPPRPLKQNKWLRRTAGLAAAVGVVYLGDRQFLASSLARNARTLYTCAMITLDYKMNFNAEKSAQIPELQERVAERMHSLFVKNGGLYIKIGQAIGANAGVLPRAMQIKFAQLFDDAPQIPYDTVEAVFTKEFGRKPSGPDGVFEVFEEKAVASASIAQVHRAKLWPELDGSGGEWVAVKVQKPDVGKQVFWDLAAYRAVMWAFENWAFDLPVYFVVDFISDHLRAELDFEEEAFNGTRMAKLIASEPRLADRVYVPKVYPEYSTKKVMTAEWIDGVRFSDKDAVLRLMGSAAAGDDRPIPLGLAAPLKGGLQSIMKTMVEVFSAQMFGFGVCHCDPHPGNLYVRPNPKRKEEAQIVLLDHGLYVTLGQEFKTQYAELWKGLLSADFNIVKSVTDQWGIGTPDLFASVTLMKPVKFGKKKEGEVSFHQMTEYEQSVMMKAKLKGFLTDTDKMPKELIFLLRSMRMVQGNNQAMGSPVNRIKLTGMWASRSLTLTPDLTLSQRVREYWYHLRFRATMFSTDIIFWSNPLRQFLRRCMGLQAQGGFEDELEKAMKAFAQGNLGVEVNSNTFSG